MEDVEDLIKKDANRESGQAFSRLLNIGDGMVGQGLRTLFLLTTNSPVRELHRALVRPGRCLANIEVPPLKPEEAAKIMGTKADKEMTLAEVFSAKTISVVQGAKATPGQYL